MRGMAMALNEAELMRLRRIVTDEDRAEALKFLKGTMEIKLKESELPHCVPVFEVAYHARQGEAFRKDQAGKPERARAVDQQLNKGKIPEDGYGDNRTGNGMQEMQGHQGSYRGGTG